MRTDSRSPTSLPGLLEQTDARTHSEPQSLAEFLRNVEIFSMLEEEMLDSVAALVSEVRLGRGEWLFHQDDEADAVYILRVGHLEILQQGEEELERINTLTRGAVLGELALLNDSRRSASVRALRETELLRIERASFQSLLRSQPELTLSLAGALSSQLQASRAIPPSTRPRPVTIALRSLSTGVPLLEIADELSWAMCEAGRVAVLYPDPEQTSLEGDLTQAAARWAGPVERCEQEHECVLMLCDGDHGAWEEFCLARADRVVVVADASAPRPTALPAKDVERLRGADLMAVGVRRGTGGFTELMEELQPAAMYAIAEESRAADLARTARRLTGRAVGAVLAGGGARAFAHLGALEVLLDAGLLVDRVAGVSMGSFIGGLVACGHDQQAIDACCYEEWVRRNPINDYTIPRAGLVKGHKAAAMLERVFGDLRIEELPLPYYCASVNLRGGHLVLDDRGPMFDAIGASISLPLIAPPMRREEKLLVDGSLLDNMPLAPMRAGGEGPVLAIDIKGGEERAGRPSQTPPSVPRRLPSLPETMSRIALLSSANTDEAARRYADLTVPVRVEGVGLLEFHQIDAAREAGRRAAHGALEGEAPAWLAGAGTVGASELTARRTVLRV